MNEYLKNIKLDNEKLESVSFYAKQKETDFSIEEKLQCAINESVDRLFRRYVPKQVRDYINRSEENKNE